MHLDEADLPLQIISFNENHIHTNKGLFNNSVILNNHDIWSNDNYSLDDLTIEKIKQLKEVYKVNIVVIGIAENYLMTQRAAELIFECAKIGISLHWQILRSAINSSLLLYSEQRPFISLLFLADNKK